MTATFGELIHTADAHYAAASTNLAEAGQAMMSQTVTAAARGIGQIAAVLSSYTVVADGPGTSSPAWVAASASAHLDLRQAAASLPPGTPTWPAAGTGAGPAAGAVRELADVVIALAVGHDLLAGRIVPAPDPAGVAYGHWADSLTAETVAVALAPDLALWCTRLADMSARLNRAQAAIPGELRYGLHAAHDHFSSAAATLSGVGEPSPMADACRAVVYAVPTTDPPRRQPVGDREPIPVLCERIATSAERIRSICAAMATDPGRPAHSSAAGWRWAARAAAVAADSGDLILTTLTEHTGHLALSNGAHIPAEAMTAMDTARTMWLLASRTARGFTTSHQPTQTSPLAGDLSDLLVRLGRVAYANDTWTPARADQAAPRAPADLARDIKELAAVISAVHDSLDALACAAAAGTKALQAAASAKALFVSPRVSPRERDLPYRFVPAPAGQSDMLVTAFGNAGETSAHACAMLNSLAVALQAPSRTLAAAHSAGHRWFGRPDDAPGPGFRVDIALRQIPAWRVAFPHPPLRHPGVPNTSGGLGSSRAPAGNYKRTAFLTKRLRPH